MSSRGAEVSEAAMEFLLSQILQMDSFDSPQESLEDINLKYGSMGEHIGWKLSEKLGGKHSFATGAPLDRVKFICKEFWEFIFGKKIDKLQTNHRGVFVLQDLKFKWMNRYICDDDTSMRMIEKMMMFVCGAIKGALENFGLKCSVNADYKTFPLCAFNIKTI